LFQLHAVPPYELGYQDGIEGGSEKHNRVDAQQRKRSALAISVASLAGNIGVAII